MVKKITMDQLRQRQAMPLELKIKMSETRIKNWYDYFNGDVYVSFSGGKDSTVLLNIVRNLYPNIPAVFVDTGLEYPEIRDFVKTIDNVIWLKPKMNFKDVIEKYGYPVVSKETAQKISEVRTTKSDKLKNIRLNGGRNGNGKLSDKWKFLIDAPFKISHKCCDVMKKAPVKKYEKEAGLMPFVGTMAAESRLRRTTYLQNGCNNFFSKRPMSIPLAFWQEADIWKYIKTKNLPYSKIYTMGYNRTGCMFCMFGVHLDKEINRFQLMKNTHPIQYKYCIEKLGCGEIMDFINVDYKSNTLDLIFKSNLEMISE